MQIKQKVAASVRSILQHVRTRPAVWVVIALTGLLFVRLIGLGALTYGDVPFFDIKRSSVNAVYLWGDEQLGTNVRQGFNTIRDGLIHMVSWNNSVFYFLKYTLPLLLIPLTYYLILKRIHIKRQLVLVIGSLLPLFTPVVFGDFLSGQTFWIYLTVPWMFYFATSIFCWNNFTLKNYLLFGLMLFLSLGMLPPIIVPLCIALFIFIVVCFILKLPTMSWPILRGYILAGLTIGVVFGILAYPYIIAGSSGQAAYAPSSLLGDYFHNYASSDLVNTLRLSGNNGSGQTTLGYNVFSSQNVFGYIFILLIAMGGLLVISEKNRHGDNAVRHMMIASLITLMSIAGFMHLMTNDTVFGVKVFQSQWIVSTIRNPSKLFVLLLPLTVILVTLSLDTIMDRMRNLRLRWLTVAVTVLAVMVYGWPAMRGDFGLLVGDGKTLASYKPDPTVQRINDTLRGDPQARSILVPASHTDELNYEKVSPGLQTLGLQGSLPDSAKIISQTNKTLNAQNKYFFNYIDALGVKNVFAKNNKKYYKDIPFSLFSVSTTPESVNDFLGKGLPVTTQNSEYTHYENTDANDKLFAAQAITNVDKDDLTSKVAFIKKNTAVVSHTSKEHLPATTSYEVKAELPNSQGATGKVQLHDPTLVIADIYAQPQGNQQVVTLDILNPLTSDVQKSHQFTVDASTSVATINGQQYTFSKNKKRISIRSGVQQITFGSIEPLSTRNLDAGFEEQYRASDGEKKKAGTSGVYANRINDGTEGKHALQLGTDNHVAFIEKELPALEPNQTYLISFDYKNNSGQSPRYAIINTADKKQTPLASSRLDANKTWTANEIFLSVDDPTNIKHTQTKTSLYLYSDTEKPGVKSDNAFDNLHVAKLHQSNTVTVTIDSYQPDYDLEDYQNLEKSPEQNLISNASFENASLWGPAHDATPGASGEAKVDAHQSSDSVKGSHSLSLESAGHTAYVSHKVTAFKSNTVYKVAFWYKNIKGNAPTFAMWQNGAQQSSPRAALTTNKDWTYFETFFIPDQSATGLQLYLYSSSQGGESINLFDDVTVAQTSTISQYLIKQSDPVEQPAQFIKGYHVQNPGKVTVDISQGKGMLVWNQSFSKGWKVYVTQNGGKRTPVAETDHVLVNGFANGWWLDTAAFNNAKQGQDDYRLTLVYTPQQKFNRYLILSMGAFTGILLYLGITTVRKRLKARAGNIS